MNDSELERIEERWTAIKDGPWYIRVPDEKDVGVIFLEGADVKDMVARKSPTSDIRHVKKRIYRSWDAARRDGMDPLMWIDAIEPAMDGGGDSLASYASITGSRDLYAQSQKDYEDEVRAYDSVALGGNKRRSKCDPPSPLFVVAKDARPEDLAFVVHAPKDMGRLLAAVREAREANEALKREAQTQKDEADMLRREANAMHKAIVAVRASCQALIDCTADMP